MRSLTDGLLGHLLGSPNVTHSASLSKKLSASPYVVRTSLTED